MNKILAKLAKYCDKLQEIAIERIEIEPHNLYGFVLAYSTDLVLIHLIDDFRLDGYRILRVRDISNIKRTKVPMRILKAEGILKHVGLASPIDLTSWESVFRDLKLIGMNIIAEDEQPGIEAFTIGKIVRVNKKSVSMRYFDATGKWDKHLTRCPYEQITRAQFDCNYVNVFSRHLKG
jgi:hypothetical protein